MKRHARLMLAFLAILALAATSCAKLQARDNLNKGVRAFRDAHYENAVKYAQLDSNNTVPYYAIGSLDWLIVFDKNNPDPKEDQLKVIDEGLANLDKALALNPDYDDAMTYKNLLYRQKADRADSEDEKKKLTDLADEWFNKGLETRKKNAEKKKSLAVGNN